MKDNFAISEYQIARAVVRAFRRADPNRPLRDLHMFDSCRETLRSGGCLCIWPDKNKVHFVDPPAPEGDPK